MERRGQGRRRPMAPVRRVSLFQREVVERIGRTAFEMLLSSAGRISEGEVSADRRYYGSTIFSIDLARVAGRMREACDEATAQRLAALLQQDRALRSMVTRLALEEARAVAGAPLVHPDTEVAVRVQGAQVLLDVDVEGQVDPARGRSAGT